MPGKKAGLRSGKIGTTLFRKQFAVNTQIAQRHLKPGFDGFVRNLTAAEIMF
jgi:hypothetical protein